MVFNKYMEQSKILERLSIIGGTLKKGISIKNILFFVLSIILVNQSFMENFTPFSFVIIGVASVFNVPLLLVLIGSAIGLAFSTVTTAVLIKLIAFFILFTLITSLINIEGISKKYGVLIKLLISVCVVEAVVAFVQGTLITSIFSLCASVLLTAILYYIFVSGIYVLININKSFVFSKEESVAMITVIALALTVFKDVNIWSFSVFNILILVLVLIYGWRNGAVSGGAAGLIIGLFLTCVSSVSMTYIVVVAISGLIAGILSKIGKVAVIIGVVLGFVYISYYAHGFSELTLRGSELLVAGLSLLFIPKKLEAKLDELFNKNNTLNKPYENILDEASHIRSKIGAISEVFDSLSDITIENTPEVSKETRDVIKKYIEDYVDNSCMECNTKRICIDEDKLQYSVDLIATKLENLEPIDISMLPGECAFSNKIVNDIQEVYNSMKLTRLLKQKEKENRFKISKQYKEVSKILVNVAKRDTNAPVIIDKSQKKLRDELKFYGIIVYEDEYVKEGTNVEYTFVTDILNDIDKQKKQIISIATDILEQNMNIKLILNSSKTEKSRIKLVSICDFEVVTAISTNIKTGEDVSGDSYISMELEDSKHMSVISDGAGSGVSAAKSSSTVINMLEKLLSSGFNEKKSIEIINSVIKLKSDEYEHSTLDVAIVNQKTAEAQFIKLGSAPTYIVEDERVITINNLNIPVGLVKDTDYLPISKTLKNSNFIIQISDGVIPDNMDVNNNFLTEYLKQLDRSKSHREVSQDINRLVLKQNNNILNDDVTILVTKVNKISLK